MAFSEITISLQMEKVTRYKLNNMMGKCRFGLNR